MFKKGKAGRNFGQTAQKREYKCLNSEQTKKLAEISASPKKNENNYAYSLGNQKAGGNFGQKGQKLHIHIVVCNVTQNLAEISKISEKRQIQHTRRRGYTRLTHQHLFHRVSHSSANNFGHIRQITYSK